LRASVRPAAHFSGVDGGSSFGACTRSAPLGITLLATQP
jgi:hypothetical protein